MSARDGDGERRETHAAAFDARPIVLLLNQGSGYDPKDNKRSRIESVLLASDRLLKTVLIGHRNDEHRTIAEAVSLCRQHEAMLVVAGGDGTVSSAATAAWLEDVPFSILPAGTFNLMSRTMGIDEDIERAARELLDATECAHTLALVNGESFLVNASIGMYPEALEEREAMKDRLGRHRFIAVFAGMRSIVTRFQLRNLVLSVKTPGGESMSTARRTPTLFVACSPLQLELLGISCQPGLGQDHLVALTTTARSAWELFCMSAMAILGKLGEASPLQQLAFTTLVVEWPGRRQRRSVKVSLDGEIRWMKAPLTFTLSDRPLRLMLPARAVGSGPGLNKNLKARE